MACGFVVVLFWGYFWPRAGLHSLSLRLKTAAALWLRLVILTTAENGENALIHDHLHRLKLFSPPLPPATSCRRKGSFPVTFRLWLKHLFPTSCYCLPTQEVHHKCQENLRSGSLCVRWWRGESVKLSWQERSNSVLSKTWVKKIIVRSSVLLLINEWKKKNTAGVWYYFIQSGSFKLP